MTGEPDLVLELQRHYDAPVERVYQAWTDLDVLTTWWGCAADMLWEVHEYDVRIGGALRVSMPIEGATFEVVGEFLAVDPPHHLSYSFGDEVVDVRIEPDG
ncbi:MAG: SRPBCC domain-containing protein, partial [Acidimicrobiia bacterium]|nr:SRPBCC domain-containing protein [Acidimicrobiia bacterium]